MLFYVNDNVIPKNYYTNMIPLISDIKLIKYFLKSRNPKILDFIQKNYIDLNMVILPWFLVIFTQIKNHFLVTLIFSRLISEGITIYFKITLILFEIVYKHKLHQITN